MVGPLVNAGAITVCGLLGCFVIRRIPERFEEIIKKAVGLSILFFGVIFSVLPVLLYQGGIVLVSWLIKDLLTPEIIREMSAAGSLLIAAIGVNFLGVKEIRRANLIPAVFIPWIYLGLEKLFAQ